MEYFNRLALQNRINNHGEIDELSEHLFRLIHEKMKHSSIDRDMVQKSSLLKVLHWAADGGRINFLHQLTESNMGFLWSSQENPIMSKIDPSTASILTLFNNLFVSLVLKKLLLTLFLLNSFVGNVLIRVIQIIKDYDRIDKDEAANILRKIATEFNLKVNEVLKLMRSSLTGLKVCFFLDFD